MPSLFDYRNLLKLCWTDAESHSEIVWWNGYVNDGRANKRKRLEVVAQIV